MDNHQARKRFGQNFLHDQNVINKIIASFTPKNSDLILEIGPGLGALTEKILNTANTLEDKLYLVEIDRDLAQILTTKYDQKIMLYNIDILKFDLNTILAHHTNRKIKIIGNLPYNISTPILFHLFKYINSIESMMFMLQLEVVDRIVASPNSKQYGRLSVMAQFFSEPQKLFVIHPNSFTPQPKVKSAIIYFKPKITSLDIDPVILGKVVTAAFNQRRKNIHNSLKELISNEDLIKLKIDPKLRAENLSVADYTKITRFIQGLA